MNRPSRSISVRQTIGDRLKIARRRRRWVEKKNILHWERERVCVNGRSIFGSTSVRRGSEIFNSGEYADWLLTVIWYRELASERRGVEKLWFLGIILANAVIDIDVRRAAGGSSGERFIPCMGKYSSSELASEMSAMIKPSFGEWIVEYNFIIAMEKWSVGEKVCKDARMTLIEIGDIYFIAVRMWKKVCQRY